MSPHREPIFNIPAAVLVTAATLILVHIVLAALSEQQWTEALRLFAFIPSRYEWSVLHYQPWYYGWGAAVWTFITYAFIHANLVHLTFNLVWLLAFATPVARRFGWFRYALFFLVAAVAGAAFHLVLHFHETSPVIGASAAISGMMAAAIRFVFQRGGPLSGVRSDEPASYQVPALPLSKLLRDPRVLIFLVMWFGLNFLFGEFSSSLPGAGENIAWEAHIGGFLAGLFGFAAFDPVKASAAPDEEEIHQTEDISENDQA